MSAPPAPPPGATSAPEFCLLLALLRAGLGRPVPEASAAPTDWSRFLALVERHRVGPFLHHRAGEALAAICPPGVVSAIRTGAAATTRRALAALAQQLRLSRLLAAAGIESLAIKGVGLAARVHGGLERRHVGDLDLLVRPADAFRADAVLQSAGLRRTRPDFPLTPRQGRAYLRLKPEFEYQLTTPPLRVELLWRLEGLPADEPAFAGAIETTVGGQPVRTIGPELETLYLFAHGARHAWFRLFWLLDVALLLQVPRDWVALRARARDVGVERAVLQGAALARDLLGVPLPPALAPHPETSGPTSLLVREALRQIGRTPAQNERFAEWLRQAAYRVRLQESPRARFAAVAPHLFSPLDWQTLSLPDPLFPLYPLLSPALVLWRRWQRRASR